MESTTEVKMSLELDRSEWDWMPDYFMGVGASYFTGLSDFEGNLAETSGVSLEIADYFNDSSFLNSGLSIFSTPLSNRASPLFFEPNFGQFGVGRFGDVSQYFNQPQLSVPTFKMPSAAPPTPEPVRYNASALPSIASRNSSYEKPLSSTTTHSTYVPPPSPPVSEKKERRPKKSLEAVEPKISTPPIPTPAPTPAPAKKSAAPPPVVPHKPSEAPKKPDAKIKPEEEIRGELIHLKGIRENFVARLKKAKEAGHSSRESFETEYRDVLALHEQLLQKAENMQVIADILRREMKTMETIFQQLPTRQIVMEKPSPTESSHWPKDENQFSLPTEDILFRPYPIAKTEYAVDFSLPDEIRQELDQKLPDMIKRAQRSLAREGIDEEDERYDKKFQSKMIEEIGQWAFVKTTPLREASAEKLQRLGKRGASSMPESLSIAEMFHSGMAECTELTNFFYAVCMHAKRNGPEVLRTQLQQVDFGFASIYGLDVPHVAFTAKYDGKTEVYDLAYPQVFRFGVIIHKSYPDQNRQDLALPQYVALLLSNKTLTAPAKDHPQLYDAALHLAAAKNAAVIHDASKYHYIQAIQAYNRGDNKNYVEQLQAAQQLLGQAEKAEGNQFIKEDLKKTSQAIAKAHRVTG